MTYVVCDRLLDAETNEHCEYDGRITLDAKGYWVCPGCHHRNYESPTVDPKAIQREFGWQIRNGYRK